MTIRYVHLTGPWPANHYVSCNAALAASADSDRIEISEAGSYPAEDWHAYAALAGITIIPTVAGVDLQLLTGTTAFLSVGTNWTVGGSGGGTAPVPRLQVTHDATHGNGVFNCNTGKTGWTIQNIALNATAPNGSGDSRCYFYTIGNVATCSGTIDDIVVMGGDPGLGYVGAYCGRNVTLAISRLQSTNAYKYRRYTYSNFGVAGGAQTITGSRNSAPCTQTKHVVTDGGGALTNMTLAIDRELNRDEAIYLAYSDGASTVVHFTAKRCKSNLAIYGLNSGTVDGTINGCYAPTLVLRIGGTSTLTGDYNGYGTYTAGHYTPGAHDVAVASLAAAKLDYDVGTTHPEFFSCRPKAGSPLIGAGGTVGQSAGYATDGFGFSITGGDNKEDIGDTEYQWRQARDTREQGSGRKRTQTWATRAS